LLAARFSLAYYDDGSRRYCSLPLQVAVDYYFGRDYLVVCSRRHRRVASYFLVVGGEEQPYFAGVGG